MDINVYYIELSINPWLALCKFSCWKIVLQFTIVVSMIIRFQMHQREILDLYDNDRLNMYYNSWNQYLIWIYLYFLERSWITWAIKLLNNLEQSWKTVIPRCDPPINHWTSRSEYETPPRVCCWRCKLQRAWRVWGNWHTNRFSLYNVLYLYYSAQQYTRTQSRFVHRSLWLMFYSENLILDSLQRREFS